LRRLSERWQVYPQLRCRSIVRLYATARHSQFTPAAPAFLAAAGFFVHGRPGPLFRLVFSDPTVLIALLDVFALAGLFVSVSRLVTTAGYGLIIAAMSYCSLNKLAIEEFHPLVRGEGRGVVNYLTGQIICMAVLNWHAAG
jgi:hypothetical protein